MLEEVPEEEVVVPDEVVELVVAALEVADDIMLLTGREELRWTAELTWPGTPEITEMMEVATKKVKN